MFKPDEGRLDDVILQDEGSWRYRCSPEHENFIAEFTSRFERLDPKRPPGNAHPIDVGLRTARNYSYMVAAVKEGNNAYFKDYFHQIRETLAQWDDLVARLDAYGRFVGYDPVLHTPPANNQPSMAAGSSQAAGSSSQAAGSSQTAGSSQARLSTPLLRSPGPVARAGPSRPELTNPYFSSAGPAARAGPSRPGPSIPSSTTSFGLYKPKGPVPLKRVTSPPSGSQFSSPPGHNYPPPRRLLQPLPTEPRDLESSKRKTLVKARLDEPPRQPYIPPPPPEGPNTRSRMGKGLKKLGNLFQ